MGSNIPVPMPVDFAALAINMTQQQAAEHFNLSVWQVIRMMRQQTPEWRAQYKEGWKARSRLAALANVDMARAAYLAARREDMANGVSWKRGVPEGFLEFMLGNSVDAATKKYKASERTIKNWKALLTPEERGRINVNATRRRADQLKAIYASRSANSKPKAEPRRPKGLQRSARSRGFNEGLVPQVNGGVASLAARHLQRHFTPVYHGEVLSKALRGQYIVGKMTLPEAEMIALARRKGFQLETWPELAA